MHRLPTSSIKQQRGVVLFVSLIALVAISLAAVAMARAVDTASLVAGNLSFKKGAVRGGDGSITTAITFLDSGAALSANILGSNYYSTYSTPTATSLVAGTITTDIDGRPIAPSVWPALSAADPATGNQFATVIQRMCTDNLTTDDAQDRTSKCVTAPPQKCNGPNCVPPKPAIYYRITTLVQGPRNTVAYVQTMVRK